VRADTDHVVAVQSLLAPTANPQVPEVNVSQPFDATTTRAAAVGAFGSLFVDLGVVALIVGAVGVAIVMIISLRRGFLRRVDERQMNAPKSHGSPTMCSSRSGRPIRERRPCNGRSRGERRRVVNPALAADRVGRRLGMRA
jgi:hypothetical protein